MPPKPKFKKEEIISAAMEIVSQKGIESLTAQELRNVLQCSASPIFTVFNTMKEVQDEVRIAAMKRFEQYEAESVADMPVFKQIGMKMVMFGVQEPKLYQLLFMQENRSAVTFDDVFGKLGDTATICIEAIEKDYNLTATQAQALFENVWIYTFGIGALCATRVCHFSEEELSQMLTIEFQAMIMLVKSGDAKLTEKAFFSKIQ